MQWLVRRAVACLVFKEMVNNILIHYFKRSKFIGKKSHDEQIINIWNKDRTRVRGGRCLLSGLYGLRVESAAGASGQ